MRGIEQQKEQALKSLHGYWGSLGRSRDNPASYCSRLVLVAVGIGIALVGFTVRDLFDYMFMGGLANVFWILAAVGVTIKSPNRDHNVSVAWE